MEERIHNFRTFQIKTIPKNPNVFVDYLLCFRKTIVDPATENDRERMYYWCNIIEYSKKENYTILFIQAGPSDSGIVRPLSIENSFKVLEDKDDFVIENY